MTVMVPIPFSHQCDRCNHTLKEHGEKPGDSRCLVGYRLRRDDPRRCLCDGYVRKPA